MADLTITAVSCPTDKYGIKCPYSMTPQYITIHNTANDASAMNEISYMLRNNNEVSYHYAVDETRAVQGIALNRNAWHAGDGGNGTGNRKSIGIEICYSKSGGAKFDAAEKNAAILTAKLLKQYGWGIEKVKRHKDWSGKYCPHRTIDKGWDRFLKMVLAELNGAPSAKPQTTTLKFKIGDKVMISGPLYVNSNATSAKSSTKNKITTITRVAIGAKHPYNTTGDLGWMDESSISKVEMAAPAAPVKKSNEEIAKEVLAGKWGNGAARKDALTKAGYNYSDIQDLVNQMAGVKVVTPAKKSNEEIAKEVIQGKWGNGAARRKNLEGAGYNYNTIQALVNKMLK